MATLAFSLSTEARSSGYALHRHALVSEVRPLVKPAVQKSRSTQGRLQAAICGQSALLAACRRLGSQPLRRQRQAALHASSEKKAWDDTEDGDLWDNIRGPPPGQINAFVPGATLKDAKIFAATRTIAVAPWSEDVTPKPIFAVSDGPGLVADLVAKMGFRQFGDVSKSIVEVVSGVETEEDVKAAIDKAATLAPEESLAIEQLGKQRDLH
eukprot:symbB.v1.2.007189.t1/scaffold436.1/size343649/21